MQAIAADIKAVEGRNSRIVGQLKECFYACLEIFKIQFALEERMVAEQKERLKKRRYEFVDNIKELLLKSQEEELAL